MKLSRLKKNKQKVVIFFCALSLLLLATSFFLYKNYRNSQYQSILNATFLYNDSTFFKQQLLSDINFYRNDGYTKTYAFLLIEQYINNGGDIYEVSNFIQRNEELSFLNKAQDLCPEQFARLFKNDIYHSGYSDGAFCVYLAYLETLNTSKYGSFISNSVLAYQYAKDAYFKKFIRASQQQGVFTEYPEYSEDAINNALSKSKSAIRSDSENVATFLQTQTTPRGMTTYSYVKGLIAYATALRYLEGMGVSTEAAPSSESIFKYVVEFSKEQLPSLYYTAVLSDVTSLLLLLNVSQAQLEKSLSPIVGFDVATEPRNSLIQKVLFSRYEMDSSPASDLLITSKKNVLELSRRSLNFKTWLIKNGWDVKDF